MADDILGNVKNLDEVLPGHANNLHNVADAKDRIAESGTKTSGVLGTLTTAISTLSSNAGNLSNILKSNAEGLGNFLGLENVDTSKVIKLYETITNSSSDYIKSVKLSELAHNDMAINAAASIGTMILPKLSDGVDGFGKFGDAGAAAGMKIVDSFKGVEPILRVFGRFGDESAERIGSVFTEADKARDAEMALFRYAAQAGDLSGVLESGKSIQDNLADGMANYAKRLTQVGDDTGRLSSEVSKYYADLARIPGALREGGVVIDEFGSKMDLVTSSIKVADAFGMNHADVVKHLNMSYRQFTETGMEGAIKQVARFAQSSQDLKMPLDMMSGYIDKVTSGMASMGDGTEAAINLADTLGKRLRDTGTSVQGTTDILGQMANAAKGMDMGQAAFISQSAGGPGGLAGAFEIEALKQEGKIDEVVRMAMTAIEKTTGPVTTLQDVRDDPSQAGQLMKQTEMLKQFGLAADNQQAFRILEGMKEGQLDIASSIKDPQEALREAIERGTEIQSTGFTKLIEISNAAQEAFRASAAANLASVRGINQSEIGGLAPDLRGAGPIAGVDEKVSMEEWKNETLTRPIKDLKDFAEGIADRFLGTAKEAYNMMEGTPKTTAGVDVNALIGDVRTPAEAMNFDIMKGDKNVSVEKAVKEATELNGTLNVDIKIMDELDKIIDRRIEVKIPEIFKSETRKPFSSQ